MLSSNYALYGDMSQRVMSALREFSPSVEAYSIDEAFLDLKSSTSPLSALGHEMKERIHTATGTPVSVGFA